MTKVDEKSLITFDGFVDVLKSFECSISRNVLKHIVDKLKVYSWRLDTVQFYRFLREVTRYSSKKWDVSVGRKLASDILTEPIDKVKVATFIKSKLRRFTANKNQGPQPGQKRERNQEYDMKQYSSKEMVDMLQEEYMLSGVDLKLQVSRQIDSNSGVEMITSDRFRDFIYEKLKFDGLSKGFID